MKRSLRTRWSGIKGDVKDISLAARGRDRIEWAAKEMPVLLSPASFPPSKSRELRDLTRTTLIQERTRLINRVHKVLEDANLKLSSVLTDMLGQTGQPILGAIIRGEEDPTVLADMALRRAAST